MFICLSNLIGLLAFCLMFGCYIGCRGTSLPMDYSSSDEFLMWCQHIYEMDQMAMHFEVGMFLLIIIILSVDVGYYLLHRKGS